MTSAVALSPGPFPAPTSVGPAKHSTDDDFTFDDLISIVNPLQHIPIVSTLYRSLTGDTIKPFERIVGDTLYGGMPGFVSAVANVVYQDVTGKDFGQTVLNFVTDDVLGNDAQTTTASSATQDSSSTADTTATAASIDPSASTATAQAASLPAPAPATSNASGPPRALQTPMPSTSPSDAATIALMHAMSSKGIDPALSQRALSAYKKSVAAPPPPQQQPPAARRSHVLIIRARRKWRCPRAHAWRRSGSRSRNPRSCPC